MPTSFERAYTPFMAGGKGGGRRPKPTKEQTPNTQQKPKPKEPTPNTQQGGIAADIDEFIFLYILIIFIRNIT